MQSGIVPYIWMVVLDIWICVVVVNNNDAYAFGHGFGLVVSNYVCVLVFWGRISTCLLHFYMYIM